MKGRRIAKTVTAGFILLLALSILVQMQSAEAIPAFARKYDMSCTTCHAPVPRLKAYGDEFAGNGFVLEDKDAPRYFVETGDENLSLIRDFPIAARIDGYIRHNTAYDRKVDLSAPYLVKLLSGGSLAKDLAYYFYFYMSERGEVVGVEDAYLMFNNLAGSELDVYLGQFQVSDPLFKRELRLTYEDYQVYRFTVGDVGANLAYDRGVMLTYGFESGTDVILEIINGNGLAKADNFQLYDEDKYKNYAARISQGLGDYLRIGGFGYYGKESDGTAENEMIMGGADFTVGNEQIELNGQFLYREDDNPFFAGTAPAESYETIAGLAELIFWPDGDRSRWYAVALYNKVDSDDDTVDYETITAHVGYVLRTNLRLVAETTYDIDAEENRIVLGFVSAF